MGDAVIRSLDARRGALRRAATLALLIGGGSVNAVYWGWATWRGVEASYVVSRGARVEARILSLSRDRNASRGVLQYAAPDGADLRQCRVEAALGPAETALRQGDLITVATRADPCRDPVFPDAVRLPWADLLLFLATLAVFAKLMLSAVSARSLREPAGARSDAAT